MVVICWLFDNRCCLLVLVDCLLRAFVSSFIYMCVVYLLLLFRVCSLLCVVCRCLLFVVVRCTLFVVSCVLFVVCCVLYVSGAWLLFVVV